MTNTCKIIDVTTTKTNWPLTILIFIIGCGIGWILIFFIPKKIKVMTFPYSSENLELAHECYDGCDIKIRTIPAEQYNHINFSNFK